MKKTKLGVALCLIVLTVLCTAVALAGGRGWTCKDCLDSGVGINCYPLDMIDPEVHDAYCACCGYYMGLEKHLPEVFDKAPTCHEPGYKQSYRCKYCKQYLGGGETLPPDANAHIPGHAATCNEPQRCTECGTILVPATGNHVLPEGVNCGSSHMVECTVCHTEVVNPSYGKHVSADDATCIKVETCSVCHQEIGPVIPDKHMRIEQGGSKAPTCGEVGNTGYKECMDCKKTLVWYEEIPATGEHTFEAGLTCGSGEKITCLVCRKSYDNPNKHKPDGVATCVKAPTCTECLQLCGPIDPDNHVHQTPVKELLPTCTEAGHTEGVHCDDCDTWLIPSEEVEKLPHTSAGDATCVKKETCSVCLNEIGDVDPDKHENLFYLEEYPASCDHIGYTAGVQCEDCDTWLKPYEDLPMLPHTSADDANCVKKETCAVCYQEIGDIDPDKHENLFYLEEYPASCDHIGYTAGVMCEDCNTWLVDSEDLEMLPHTPGVEATCEEDQVCTVCGEVLVERLGHHYGPYEDVDGHLVSTCAHCHKQVSKPCYLNLYDFTVMTEEGYVAACPVCGHIGEKQGLAIDLENVKLDAVIPEGVTLHVYALENPFKDATMGLMVSYQKNGALVKMDDVKISITMEKPEGRLVAVLDGELFEIDFTYEDGVLTFNTMGYNVFYFAQVTE